MVSPKDIQISIDRGGTFTDVHASYSIDGAKDKGRKEEILKLLSKNDAYEDAPREGVRQVLERIYNKKIDRSEKLDTDEISWIRLSTTVGTNALLERNGAKHALLITKGFRDLLLIGNQARPRIFDLAINKPDVLYERVVEVDERVTLVGYTSDPKRREREVLFDEEGNVTRAYDGTEVAEGQRVVRGDSGEAVRIIKTPDLGQVKKDLEQLYSDGFRSVAVVLIHAFTFPEHERLIGKVAQDVGFSHVSLSSRIMPVIKAVPRGTSSTCDAYLTPVLKEYIDGFFNGFDESLRRGVEELEQGRGVQSKEGEGRQRTRVEFMTSDGGLTDVATFSGLHSILSGPAGGSVGCALTSWDEKRQTPVIGLDMGGTSTDVSRFDGRYELVFETTTAGVTVQSPQLDINTVAAGGGSRLFYRNAAFVVGPESAGASPGPACYRKGGPLAVTDANLVLGRLLPDFFPRIFGKNEDETLDPECSQRAFEQLADEINASASKKKSVDEIAWGFVQVANETMARPIRALTEARGYSTAKHILSCFGGAGGQHACSIASTLGIKTILIHRYSSVLSAYGMSLADRVVERQEPSSEVYSQDALPKLRSRLEELATSAKQALSEQGFKEERINIETYLNMRFDGTDTALMTLPDEEWDFMQAFQRNYKNEFGFLLKDKDVIVDDVRVRGIGKSFDSLGRSVFEEAEDIDFTSVEREAGQGPCERVTSVYFQEGGRQETPVYKLDDLGTGSRIEGPAIILDGTQTIICDKSWTAKLTSKHVLMEKE